MNELVVFAANRTPALIKSADDRTTYRFLEFFVATIRNPNTRRA